MDILINDFIRGILVFLRITAVVFTAPVLSQNTFPTTAKIILSLLVTYIVMFSITDFNYDVNQGMLPLAILGIKEMFTGFVMGFTLQFVFYGIGYAGLLIGNDMGLGAAQMFDLSSESQSNIIGSILALVAVIIFILINGHHFIINAVCYSFKIIPLGYFNINQDVADLLIKYSSGIFIIAVKIASPIIVSFFLLNVSAGIMARVVPQMQILFVLFPLKIALGFIMMISLVPIYVYVIKNLLLDYETKLFNLLQAMST